MDIMPLQVEAILSGALVAFTAGLMVVTYLYYQETKNHTEELRKSRHETRNHTEEMKKAREAEFKPIIKCTIEEWHGLHHRFAFENTGKGAAHNVTAWWGFEHIDYEEEWKIPLMTPGQMSRNIFTYDIFQ